MVGRHKGSAERGRSGAVTYNAQVPQVFLSCFWPVTACQNPTLLFDEPP